ncbi:hypothetical protein BDM02DRAFT_3118434 [Thelephora ganbajun]|uniref:Uncharacterized protein n=1 Tax=Thelephora ganbajun TaxID=370292 RepID=A0ACB6ZAI9_THEGA|nr:hypothetical protein BDM02DRAFT_3118434 [Thelephora ganbajun]
MASGKFTTQFSRQTYHAIEGSPLPRLLLPLPPTLLRNSRMKLTLAQNLPLRTYIINSSNEILYQVNTPDNGSFTTIARKYSATLTSDTASECTLVGSQWCQLARLCWKKPESSQIHIPALAQRQDNFKSFSREFVFTASDCRTYAWKLGPLGTSNPTLVLKDNPEEVLVAYRPNSSFRPAIRSHLDIVDREDVLSIQDDIILTFVLVQRCRRLMGESHLPPPQTWFAHAESSRRQAVLETEQRLS